MIWAMLFIIGMCVGSFVMVLVDRLPRGEDVVKGRSHCDRCKRTLAWWELIPVVSFILLGARCRTCHMRFSPRYPISEIICGLMLAWLGWELLPLSLSPLVYAVVLFAYASFMYAVMVIALVDTATYIIPDSMIVVGIGGVVVGFAVGVGPPVFSALGSALGSALFFFILWSVTKGRGMGFGDVKLGFLIGLFLGFPDIIIALYGAFLTGALAGVILMIRGRKTLKSRLPFGPFLVVGMSIAYLWGDRIFAWWSRI